MYALEHRKVMSRTLRRALRKDEIVHHVNGDKTDNRPENLMVMTQGEHVKIHHQKLTPQVVKAIKGMQARGMRLHEIARDLSLSVSTVHKGSMR